MDRNVKYLIIGAGISGLTFANYANGDYLIIEKEDEVGGYCRTIKKRDYVWDYAGHFFHFSTDEFKKKFLDSVDPDEIKYKDKNTKIMYKGKLIDYPFQTNIHQLDKQEFIDCLYDLFHRNEKEEYSSFLDMLYGKFGKSIVEKFLKPYNEKLYAVDLTTLDKDAMGRFFPYADIPAIIDNMKANKDSTSYNNTFLYPKSGAGSFIQILYDALDKSKVLLGHRVTKINNDEKTAELDDGSRIGYEYLINTSPLNEFLTYFDGEEFRNLRDSLSYNKVLVFNLGFDRKSKFTKEHWFYIPDKSVNFYRIGFYDNILDADKLSMYIEIGYNKDDVIDADKQLEYASTLIEQAQNITNEAKKKGNTNFFSGFARGFKDAPLDGWAMGLQDLKNYSAAKKVMDKVDRGEELSPSEDALMQALVTNAATQMYYSGDLGRGYKAGGVTAESLPFMLDMIAGMGTIQAVTKPASKALVKYATEKAAKMGLGRATTGLAKGAARTAAGLGDVAAHTATFGGARVASDYQRRGLGDVQVKVHAVVPTLVVGIGVVVFQRLVRAVHTVIVHIAGGHKVACQITASAYVQVSAVAHGSRLQQFAHPVYVGVEVRVNASAEEVHLRVVEDGLLRARHTCLVHHAGIGISVHVLRRLRTGVVR